MNINNPWLVGIGAPLIVLGIISWLKRDLPDKKVFSLNWAEEYKKDNKLPEDSLCWPSTDGYESRGFEPVYFYPYRFWFRQKIVCKEHILCFSKKYKKGT